MLEPCSAKSVLPTSDVMLAPQQRLCSVELLYIVSFLSDSVKIDSFNKRSRDLDYENIEEQVDSDINLDTYTSDIDRSSDEDNDVDINNIYAFDDHMERQYYRQQMREIRHQEARQRRYERSQRAERRKVQLREIRARIRREARDIIAMAGTCSLWRDALCAQSSDDADLLLWKPLFRRLFPHADYRSVQKDIQKIHFFSLFQLIVKVSGINTTAPRCERDRLLKEVDLHDIIFVLKFEHGGSFETSHYASIGRMNTDNIVSLHIPAFVQLCENKNIKWLKEASNKKKSRHKVNRYDDDESIDYNGIDFDHFEDIHKHFPKAEIFVGIPGRKNTPCQALHIYSGHPIWRKFRNVRISDYGPQLHNDDIIAPLSRCFFLALQQKGYVTFCYHASGLKGDYSEERLDSMHRMCPDYDSDDETEFRESDVKSFIIGA